MFWKILFDSIARRKKRKALAVLTVWIGISLVVGLLMLSLDTGDKMNLELRSFGANIKVLPVSSAIPVKVGDYELDIPKDSAYLTEKDFPKLKEIFWRNNILGIVPRLWAEGEVNGKDIPILGLWFEHKIPTEAGEDFLTGAHSVYKHWKVEGRWPSPENAEGCLLGTELSRSLRVSLGDMLEVKGKRSSARLKVSGIVSTGDKEDFSLIASLRIAQELAGLEGKVSEADVSALTTPENKLAEKYRLDPKTLTPAEYERWYCTPYPENVASGIQEVIQNSAARVIRRVSQTQGAVLTRIEGLVFFLAFVTLLSCSLSIMGILASAVLERLPEVALLQAIGAERVHVLTLFLVEVALLGLLGGLLGGLTGTWMGRELVKMVFASQANHHLTLLILSPFLGLLVAWLGSVWPVLRALNTDTVRVLHGD